jgi:hypothetical protein
MPPIMISPPDPVFLAEYARLLADLIAAKHDDSRDD